MTTERAAAGSIIIADDDSAIVELLTEVLADDGHRTVSVGSGDALLAQLQQGEFSMLLMDLQMPGVSGLELLERVRGEHPDLPVIVITGHGTSSIAIRAIQIGAYDYIQKPFDIAAVSIHVRRCLERQALAARVRTLEQSAGTRERMIGASPAMAEIYKTIGRVAASDVSVLITGETGTGKELAANLIHQNSNRRGGPMVRVNCAALPETLIESELFGHEKGAFTGAVAQRKGRFELANKGTIFLDEVGEISLAVQKKLLRVLQEGEIERVGGTGVIRVDVRVIAATNRDLLEEIERGRFREDLYYRLNVVNLHMPSLRERRGDIILLVEHFLDKYRYTPGSPPAAISDEALEQLQQHDWPGNVRQLENEIERAVALSQGTVITSHTLTLAGHGHPTRIDLANRVRNREPLDAVLAEVERTLLHEALRQSDGDDFEAARRLGLNHDEFARRLAAR